MREDITSSVNAAIAEFRAGIDQQATTKTFRGKFTLPEELHGRMLDHAMATPDVETGGMLFGTMVGAGGAFDVTVTDVVTVPPEGASQSRTHFVIKDDYARPLIDELQNDDQVYLGPWHSHTNRSGPSFADRHSVRQLLRKNPGRTAVLSLVLARDSAHEEGYEPYIEIFERRGTEMLMYPVLGGSIPDEAVDYGVPYRVGESLSAGFLILLYGALSLVERLNGGTHTHRPSQRGERVTAARRK